MPNLRPYDGSAQNFVRETKIDPEVLECSWSSSTHVIRRKANEASQMEKRFHLKRTPADPGHELSEFYEGGLEKGFSKLNLRKVRRRPGGGRADEH